jgi:hypothetical protein
VRLARVSDGSAAFPVEDAYRILSGTARNCSGGARRGQLALLRGGRRRLVWECDPTGRCPAVARPAMGGIKREAATSTRGAGASLTEDLIDGGFYRVTPTALAGAGRGAA